VQLKPFTTANITPAYLGWLNDRTLMRYSNQRFRTHTMDSCQDYLASFLKSDNLFLAIYFAEQFVGTMTAYRSVEHQTTDIGLLIGAGQQGKGLGKDAWKSLMSYLLANGTRKVTGGTLRCNTAMLRIMQDCGMQPDGVRIAQELIGDQPQDVLHFAKFNQP
jgi:RimJ/RimL family protein N-acetyltransferase